MPGGKVHLQLWERGRAPAAILSVGAGMAALNMGLSLGDAASLAGATLAGYMVGGVVGPDLDLIGIDRSEALAIRSVIFLPLIAWSTMYARIMQVAGGHRSFWSHTPFLSTFIRLCWFLFPFVVLMHSMGWLGQDYSIYFMGLWLGLGLSDTIHALADFGSSLFRRKRRARQAGGCT